MTYHEKIILPGSFAHDSTVISDLKFSKPEAVIILAKDTQ